MEDMKKKKDDGPMKKDAKLSALKGLRDTMSEMMKGDLGGKMKNKVTVAAPSKEGLSEGLDKAKELLGGEEGSPGFEGDETPEIEKQEASMEHANEAGSDESEPEQGHTEAEIDEMMAHLAEMKKKLAKS